MSAYPDTTGACEGARRRPAAQTTLDLHDVETLDLVARTFVYGDADAFDEMRVARAAGGWAADPLSPEAYAAAQRALFVAGTPLAALPVESLYRPWAQEPGPFGKLEGLYLSDGALHIRHLLHTLGLACPGEFSGMPDHLAIELDLFGVLLETGDPDRAAQFARDHLGWLGRYADTLAERGARAQTDAAARGIAFYGRLARTLDESFKEFVAEHDAVDPSCPRTM